MTYHLLIRKSEHRDLSQIAQLFDQYRQFYGEAADWVLAGQYIGVRMDNNDSVILVVENAEGGLDGFC